MNQQNGVLSISKTIHFENHNKYLFGTELVFFFYLFGSKYRWKVFKLAKTSPFKFK